jgi:hypothetical protein
MKTVIYIYTLPFGSIKVLADSNYRLRVLSDYLNANMTRWTSKTLTIKKMSVQDTFRGRLVSTMSQRLRSV